MEQALLFYNIMTTLISCLLTTFYPQFSWYPLTPTDWNCLDRSINPNVAERWLNDLMTTFRHASCETFRSGHMHCLNGTVWWRHSIMSLAKPFTVDVYCLNGTVWSQAWNTTLRIRNLPLLNPYWKYGREALYNIAGTLHRDFQSGGTHKKWRVRLT